MPVFKPKLVSRYNIYFGYIILAAKEQLNLVDFAVLYPSFYCNCWRNFFEKKKNYLRHKKSFPKSIYF